MEPFLGPSCSHCYFKKSRHMLDFKGMMKAQCWIVQKEAPVSGRGWERGMMGKGKKEKSCFETTLTFSSTCFFLFFASVSFCIYCFCFNRFNFLDFLKTRTLWKWFRDVCHFLFSLFRCEDTEYFTQYTSHTKAEVTSKEHVINRDIKKTACSDN